MPRGPKFFSQMTQAQIDELEEYARHKGRKISEVLEWITLRGIGTSDSAVQRWLQDFRMWDLNHRAREAARDFVAAQSDADSTAVNAANLKRLDDLVYEALLDADAEDVDRLGKIARTIRQSTASLRTVKELQAQRDAALKIARDAASKGEMTDVALAAINDAFGINRKPRVQGGGA